MTSDEEKMEGGTGDQASVLEWHSIDGVASVLEWHIKELQVGKKKTTLLSDVAGRVSAGDFLVLLGPSGSGKTSLLECLSLRNRDFVGALRYNGKRVGSDYYTNTALVYQQDMLYSFLTPRQHLLFHAGTRMFDFTAKERYARVEAVAEELELAKCMDTMIGGSEVLYDVKGISGGERKRLSIAAELLLCPSLIFLDEPTSGLDSNMAEGLALTLQRLSSRGITVISSMHCPSSTIAQHFSTVLLLTPDGRTAYHGPYQQASRYLSEIGRPMPPSLMVADYMIWLVSRRSDDPGAHRSRLDALVKAFRESSYDDTPPLPVDTHHVGVSMVKGRRADQWTLYKLNLWRAAIRIRCQRFPLFAMTLCFVLLGLLFGLLFYQQAPSNWRSMFGVLFLTTTVTLTVAGTPSMIGTCVEWPRLTREYLSGSNSLSAALLAYSFLQLPYMVGPALFAAIVYWMAGFASSLSSFLVFVGVVLLVDWSSVALSILIGSICPSPAMALSIAPMIFTPMMVFAGVLYQRSAVPAYLTWMHNVSIINYGFMALIGSQAHILSPLGEKLVLGFCEVDPNDVGKACFALFLMGVIYQTLIYWSVKLRLMYTKTHK